MSKTKNSDYYLEKFLNKHVKAYKNKSEQKKKEYKQHLPMELYKILNPYLLKKTGKKEYDYLYCNDLSDPDEIFSYKTVNDWDKANWLFQKNGFFKRGDKDYFNRRFGKTHKDLILDNSWFRWFYKQEFGKKREFQYASLFSVAHYILDELNEFMNDWLDSRIPNEDVRPYGQKWLVPIKKGKDKGMFVSSPHELRAGGLEKELKQMKKLIHDYYQSLSDWVHIEAKCFDGMTFMRYVDHKEMMFDKDEIYVYVLIGGKPAAKKMSFRTFLSDVHQYKQPFGLLENKIDALKQHLTENVFPEFERQVFNEKK